MSIAELLSGPYLLNIPTYQRPYSWGREQVEQLYDDLLEASGLGTEEDADAGYFLGTILLMDTPGNKTTRLSPKMPVREFDVVDGQQRLVTLLTLIAVLRDLDTDPRRPLVRRSREMFIAQVGSRFFRSERPRLQLGGTDGALFEQEIVMLGSTDKPTTLLRPSASEQTLIAARDLLRTLASDMPAEARKTLFDYIADRCQVVVIVSHDIDRAHRAFVVLNERGKRLQKNDILKADVLSRLPAAKVVEAAEAWDRVSAELGDNFEQFFAHLRAAYGYNRPQVVSGVRAVIREVGGAEIFFDKVFLPLATAYSHIRGDTGNLPESLRRRLLYLNRLPDGDWAPAAMLALMEAERNPSGGKFLLEEIDRQAHLLRLLCTGTGKRLRRFSDIISVIRSGDVNQRNHPAFQITRDEMRNISFHLKDMHKRNAKACKLLLLRLNDEMSGKPSDIDPDDYTIEHILPQRPAATSVWREWFPTAEERSDCVESLGNLVLITQSQNDKAKNASWAEKKAIYAAATPKAPLLAITRDVLEVSEWRRADIEAREQRLIELIEGIWRVELRPRPSRSAA